MLGRIEALDDGILLRHFTLIIITCHTIWLIVNDLLRQVKCVFINFTRHRKVHIIKWLLRHVFKLAFCSTTGAQARRKVSGRARPAGCCLHRR